MVTSPPVGGDALRSGLERLLTSVRGEPVRIGEIHAEPSPFAGRAPAEVVRVTLRSGDEVVLFVKWPADDDHHPDKLHRDREAGVYSSLLASGSPLPVAEYLGTLPLPGGPDAIVLAHVDDWDLRYQSMDLWITAAEQLGVLHARFAADPRLVTGNLLLRLDASYLEAWAARATLQVARRSSDLSRTLARSLRAFDELVRPLARSPRTLVHNDLAPKNVLADRSQEPTRIVFVDWELAGVGCGMLDLVHLAHGLGPADRRAVLDAYVGSLAGSGLVPDDPSEVERLEAACRLHKTLYRLAHADVLDVTTDTVGAWVRDVRQLREQV